MHVCHAVTLITCHARSAQQPSTVLSNSLLAPCFAACLGCCLQVNAYMFGSVPLRTYLPDGDIDLSVFCSQEVAQSVRDTWALKLQSVIEQEQRSNSNAPYKIGDVTVINAEVGQMGSC